MLLVAILYIYTVSYCVTVVVSDHIQREVRQENSLVNFALEKLFDKEKFDGWMEPPSKIISDSK